MSKQLEQRKSQIDKFYKALVEKDIAGVETMLIENSAIDNMKDEDFIITLRWAAGDGDERIVELLLLRMNLESINSLKIGGTALHSATEFGQERMVEILLSKMSSEAINATEKYRKATALHTAAEFGQKTMVEILLSKMSPTGINAIDELGNTALHLAAEEGHRAVVKMLFSKMSREAIFAVNNLGSTAFDYNKIIEMRTLYKNVLDTMAKASQARDPGANKDDSETEDKCAHSKEVLPYDQGDLLPILADAHTPIEGE